MSKRITPSLIISIIALMVALGGASYAAIQIPKNSVGTKQLKKNAVNAAKLKKNSVNSAKVRDGSLLRSDFKAGQLPGTTWYQDRQPTVTLFDVTDDFIPVVSTAQLPEGSYVLAARANVIGGGGVTSRLICYLANDAAQNFTVANGGMFPLSMSAAVVLKEPTAIRLWCNRSTGSPQIAQAHIIATRVTEVIGSQP
jgi:hypothetical protein